MKKIDTFGLQWHITKRCNLRCTHCYQEDYSLNSEMSFEELVKTFIKMKDFIRFVYKDLVYKNKNKRGYPSLSITGGEPFVRSDFMKFLEIITTTARNDFVISILTNGTLLSRSICNNLKNFGIDYVQVSIDGDEKTHDLIRGKGTYKKAIKGIEYLVNEGVRVSISFTAHKSNYKSFPKVIENMKKLGANFIWSNRAIPFDKNKDIISLSNEETKEYCNIINEQRQKYIKLGNYIDFEIGNPCALQQIYTDSENEIYSCHAGIDILILLENGDVLPCRRMPVKIGNIRETSLKDIYLNNEFMKQLRRNYNIPVKGCENCKLAQKCRGGLKCLSYAFYQNPHIKDPGCWISEYH